jgi:glycosyltransferase involved in cell wall biosynthesis
MRLLIIGTHPYQTTGYSKVVYNICKSLASHKDVKCTVFGIQKFTKENDNARNDLPSNVSAWDVFANDKEDFGFGTQTLNNFVSINQPDVVLVYNDPNVVEKYIMNLNLIKNRSFKIVVYLDQLYTYQNVDSIKYIANHSDHIFCFTEYWRNNLLSYLDDEKSLYNKIKERSSVVKHGIDSRFNNINPIQAKLMINFLPTDFIFLNLNRIQGRKRPDLCVMAFALFLKNTNAQNAYLFFPNIRDKKLDILKIFEHSLKKYNLPATYKLKLKFLDNIEKVLTDDEINIIYNACDIGVNTCEAEGFGLCNYEHASLGKPQIVSGVGGLLDFFNNDNSITCNPKVTIYTDNGGDIFGNSEIIDIEDVAKAMETYYTSKKKREDNGKKCLEIKNKYNWQNETNNLLNVLKVLL